MPDVSRRGLYWLLLVIAAMAGSAGCSTRGVYEGIQQQEASKNPPPAGQPATRRPTYDEYETERRKTGAQ
jgi:hypothetical protein